MATESQQQQNTISTYAAMAEVHRMATRLLEEFGRLPNEYQDMKLIPQSRWDELFHYLVLLKVHGDEGYSPTLQVDLLWHQLILNVNLYSAVCGDGTLIPHFTGRATRFSPQDKEERRKRARDAMKKLFVPLGVPEEKDEEEEEEAEEEENGEEEEEEEEEDKDKENNNQKDSLEPSPKRPRTNGATAVGLVSSNNNNNDNKALVATTTKDVDKMINVRFRFQTGEEMHVRAKPQTRISKLYACVSTWLGIPDQDFRLFSSNGDPLRDHDYLEDDDCIYVIPAQQGC